MKTVLARLRRCFIGILLFSILFILWSVWLGVSVNAVQKHVASNVALLKDLSTLGTVLREMGRLPAESEQWQRLEKDCRVAIQVVGTGGAAYPEIQQASQSAAAAVAGMTAIRAQLLRPGASAETTRRQEHLYQAQADAAVTRAEAAVAAVRRRQTELSIVLANKWTQMDCMAVVSCLMAAVLALLFRSFQQTTAIRFNMQEELETSEDQFRALFEDAPVAYHEMDPQGIVLRVNRAECALLGYQPRQMVGKPIWEFVADSCREASREALRRKLAGEEPFSPLETGFVRKDGALLILQVHESGIRNHRGEVTGIRSTLLDITGRKKAEQALRESVSVVNATLEATADGILVVDRAGRMVGHNRRFLDLWRIPESVAASKDNGTLIDFLSAQVEDPESFRKNAELLNMEPARETFDTVEFKDGRIFERCSRPQQIGVEIVGRVWSFRDVTAHRKALSELRASEERWQLAVRGTNDGLWDWNADTDEVFYSARWKEMLGFEEHELKNSSTEWRSRVHPDDLSAVTQQLQDHLDGKAAFYTAEYRLRAKDGTYRWILARGQALWDENGRPTRLVGAHKDITERRLAEDALRIAKEEAECASRAKGEFLANMSHEIRTPMAGVLGMIDLVLSTELSSPQKENLEIARASADSLLSLLNDILDLSKVEAGRLDLTPAVFSVRQSVGDAMRMFAVRAQEKNLSFTTHLDEKLPERMIGDPLRLRQILVNLVGNAIKFTDDGCVSVCVRPETRRGSQVKVLFEVIDTGVGIPLEMQKAVFDPFRQVDGSSTRRFVGTGLGLTISARLVQLMGGTLDVKSVAGKGSRFYFTVPFTLAEVEAPVPIGRPMSLAPPARNQFEKRKLRILVAEDNLVNQKLANILLKREGHEVVVVGDGREAVAAVAEGSFDLVLMDVQMPAMDGFEATAVIRHAEAAAGRHTPIVAMTAHAMKGDHENCLAAGMDDYLSKPFDVASLRAVLGKFEEISRPAKRMTS
jgi:PAS domain S-box-containing protein